MHFVVNAGVVTVVESHRQCVERAHVTRRKNGRTSDRQKPRAQGILAGVHCETERRPEYGNIFEARCSKNPIARTPEANHRTERLNAGNNGAREMQISNGEQRKQLMDLRVHSPHSC